MSDKWHFLDKRSKAIASNQDGLKIEFASHMDGELGKRVIESLNIQVVDLQAQLEAANRARAEAEQALAFTEQDWIIVRDQRDAALAANERLVKALREAEGLVAQAYPAMEERQKESPIGYKEVQDAN